MDLLIHVSAADLARDLHNYLKPGGSKTLDRFAPEWHKHVDTRRRRDVVRQEIVDYWRSLLQRELGTSSNDWIAAVKNSKNATLYWLVFASRAKLAHKLWEAIANISPQKRLL